MLCLEYEMDGTRPFQSGDRWRDLDWKHSVRGKLEGLPPEQVNKLKEAFIKNKHLRFKKEFAASRHQPFGKTSDYIASIQNADSCKIVKLVKFVGMVLQVRFTYSGRL